MGAAGGGWGRLAAGGGGGGRVALPIHSLNWENIISEAVGRERERGRERETEEKQPLSLFYYRAKPQLSRVTFIRRWPALWR